MRFLSAAVALLYAIAFAAACLGACLGQGSAAEHACCQGEAGLTVSSIDCCKVVTGTRDVPMVTTPPPEVVPAHIWPPVPRFASAPASETPSLSSPSPPLVLRI